MPQYVDERTLLSNMAPNNGDMAAVAELDPRTWQGQLRRNKLSAFVDPYQLLMADPNSTYGTLVPAVRDNATGEMRFALPTMLRDIGIGGLDALAGRQVGELTPLATGAISALPFGGAAPSGSLRAGAALRTQRAATSRSAVEAARTASTNSARQAWVWKTPEGKFLVNAGDRPEGAKLVGRAIGDEWFSGPGLMAKAGSKEVGAAEVAGKTISSEERAALRNLGFRKDNPGGEWLAQEVKKASEDFDRYKGLRGAVTGYVNKYFDVPTELLTNIPGARNEVRNTFTQKYKDLAESVTKRGWQQKDEPILIGINYKGEPYILEGNTRATYAAANNIPTVNSEFRWWGGSESGEGPWSQYNLAKRLNLMAKSGDDSVGVAQAYGKSFDVQPTAGQINTPDGPASVHMLPITPELREAAMKGFPTFARFGPGIPLSSFAPSREDQR